MKDLSSGIIIVNEFCEILMGRTQGTNPAQYDIFKGLHEPDESVLETAIRECYEESGLIIKKDSVIDLGQQPYNSSKDLHIFITYSPENLIDLKTLKCISTYYSMYRKQWYPEISGYRWVSIDSIDYLCCKSLSNVLKNKFHLSTHL